jgi:hypothetical protein
MPEGAKSKTENSANDLKLELIERIHDTRLFAIERAAEMRNQAIGVLVFAALILGIAGYLFIDKTIEDRLGDMAEEKYRQRAETAASGAEALAQKAQDVTKSIEAFKSEYETELQNLGQTLASALEDSSRRIEAVRTKYERELQRLPEIQRAALKERPNSSSAAVINPHEGFWGDWTKAVYCPANHFVCGMKVRMEGDQGKDGDDTALNSVELQCCPF